MGEEVLFEQILMELRKMNKTIEEINGSMDEIKDELFSIKLRIPEE